jgi:hypothetical protein
MPAYFKIDKEHRLVMSTISGVLTMADALAHQENLRKHPDFDPSFSQLMDGTQLTRVELKREEVQRLARDSIFSPDSRRAFVTNSDAAFGMARMFETLRDAMGEKGIRVFRNLDEGLDWVLGKNSPA